MRKVLALFLAVLSALTAKAQFCSPTFTNGCSVGDQIHNFTATGSLGINISNLNSGCNGSAPNYTTFFPQTVADFPGATINFTVQAGPTFAQGFRIWVDWNNDLQFTASESVWASAGSSISLQTGSFTIPMTAAIGQLRMRVMCRYVTVPTPNDFCGTGFSWGEVEDYTLQVISPTPCSGQPTAGTINGPSVVNLCPSASYNLTVSGSSALANLSYFWLTSPVGANTWSLIPGATSAFYTIPPGQPSADYCMVILCNNSFQFDTTNVVTVLTTQPKKATLPYAQSFENWMNYCSNSDVPDDSSWTNLPFTGNLSWRRQDQGLSAGWLGPNTSNYSPPSSHLNHSARLHTYYGVGNGDLDLHIDLSSVAGTKTLNFDYIIDALATNPYLIVGLSTNGGTSFTYLDTFNGLTTGVWQQASLPIASNSANAVIRFRGKADFQYYGDIGLDNVQVLTPCSGAPTAGVILDTSACPNVPFTLQLQGNTLAGGLTYTWQSALTATGPWTTIATTSQPFTVTSQPGLRWYRCQVTCTNSGQMVTTPAQDIPMNLFYYCYCQTSMPAPGAFDYVDIGNVHLYKNGTNDTIIWHAPLGPADTFSNASATAGYTNKQFTVPVRKIFRDSTYNARVVAITQFTWVPSADTRMYIDFNRDGSFQSNEIVLSGANILTSGVNNLAGSQFTVPSWASPGITGLRVITNTNGGASQIDTCDTYFSGETEDYLVEIALPACSAPISGGTVYISDTLICPGYSIVLIDTTHTSLTQTTGLSARWQRSIDNGITWTNIPGVVTDTLVVSPTVTTLYRYRIICNTGPDTAYSNIVKLTTLAASTCYPASGALWGSSDTADNGAFGIGTYLFTAGGGGPHVGNPAAIRSRTDLSANPLFDIILWTDSTYNLTFYNILRPYNHADARITMFIDYNNDGQYQIPSERVFTGQSTATNFVTTGTFKTPLTPVLNTNTGLRVVLNSNSAPNPESDNGVGLYVSGETEDYSVRFRKKPIIPAGIDAPLDLSNVSVYPNPTTGMLFIDINAAQIAKMNVIVTTVTGQEVFRAQHTDIAGKFSTSIDLGSLAAGTYMLKLQTEKGSVVRSIILN